MGKTLGFGVVLAAAYLTGSLGAAYAQEGAGGQAAHGNAAPSAIGGGLNNVEQPAAQAAGLTSPTTPSPAVPGQTTTTVPGQTIGGVPALGTMTTTPASTYPTPGMTGTVANPVGTVTTYPGTATYSSNDYQAGTYPRTYMGATPVYTNQIVPGRTSVTPMASTQMAPGSYSGTAGTPYTTYYTPGYAWTVRTPDDYIKSSANVVQRRGYGEPSFAAATAAPAVGVTYSPAYVAPTGSAANMVKPAQGPEQTTAVVQRYVDELAADSPAERIDLGIDAKPITEDTGKRGIKVTKVYPERAGLQVGDVIYTSNGFLTQQPRDLAWIIAHAARDTRLNLSVKSARDGREHSITAELP
jgi:hypothetical protein